MNFVHHIDGRLRLKFPELRNRIHVVKAVEKAIRQLPTVRLVQANAVTGSLLIHYDARGKEQTNLLEAIEDVLSNRFGLDVFNRVSRMAVRRSLPSHGNPIADRVVDMMIEKIVERSALALLGVLL